MIFVLMGFLAGIAMVAATRHTLFLDAGFVQTEFDNHIYLSYILKLRLPEILIVWLLGYTLFGQIGINLYVLIFGARTGIFLTACFFTYGIGGIFVFLAFCMPQFPIYAIVVFGMLICSQKNFLSFFYYMDQTRRINLRERKMAIKVLGEPIVGLLLMSAGCLVECYVNPILLKFVLKFF